MLLASSILTALIFFLEWFLLSFQLLTVLFLLVFCLEPSTSLALLDRPSRVNGFVGSPRVVALQGLPSLREQWGATVHLGVWYRRIISFVLVFITFQVFFVLRVSMERLRGFFFKLKSNCLV